MKYLFFILIIFISCKKEVDKTISCNKENFIIKDTVFGKTDILASIFYDKNCKIKKLSLLTLLDKRSGNITSKGNMKSVTITLGLIGDTLINDVITSNKFQFDKIKSILFLDYTFDKPFLDSLNLIDIKTIATVNDLEKLRILKSDSYFYKNSAKLLGIKNSYLDYRAYKDKKLMFTNLSKRDKFVDSILVTVKTVNQIVDNITDYKIILNNKELRYKYSIKASFNYFKLEDKGCKLYDVLKINSNFLQFKLNVQNLNLKSINNLDVFLDETRYE